MLALLNNFTVKFNIKETIYIGWKKPHDGWIKLKCDCACDGVVEPVGCSRLFCNSYGRWIRLEVTLGRLELMTPFIPKHGHVCTLV